MHTPSKYFEKRLREKISAYFGEKNVGKYADKRLLMKCIFLFSIFISTYLLILFTTRTSLLIYLYGIHALSAVMLAINIGHEAIHRSLSGKKNFNRLGKLTFYLAGVNPDLWSAKHLHSHHKHTNNPELDSDFQQSKLVRLHTTYPHSFFHNYQYLYLPFLYLLYTFHWTYIKDFREAIILSRKSRNYWFLLQVAVHKTIYALMVFAIPWHVHSHDPMVLAGFACSYLITGAFFGLFLIPVHINDYAVIHTQNFQRQDFIHQLEATPNYSINNLFLNFALGGFNHHACHHLFPNISHIHYLELTKIIRQTCLEEKIKYVEISFAELIKSHFRYIKKISKAQQHA